MKEPLSKQERAWLNELYPIMKLVGWISFFTVLIWCLYRDYPLFETIFYIIVIPFVMEVVIAVLAGFILFLKRKK